MCIFNTDCITIQYEQNILITILRVDIYQTGADTGFK